MANPIHVDQRKWPDREHYQFEMNLLGRDQYGTWVHTPPGTLVRRGDDDPFRFAHGVISVVPDDEWWVASFYRGHAEIDLYVDIGTPPVWHGARLTYVDLDLDVIRLLDGTVEIIDEDEFEENRVVYDYPDELAVGAREAAERAVRLVTEQAEPFVAAADRWFELRGLENMRELDDLP